MSSDEESLHQNREKFTVERSDPQPDEVNPDFFGPALPPHLLNRQTSENDEQKKEIYGPTLPDFLRGRQDIEKIRSCPEEIEQKSIIGPEIPEYLRGSHSETIEEEPEPLNDMDEGFGPSTNLMATEVPVNYYRSIGSQNSIKKDTSEPSVEREEWMTQLPEKKRTGIGLFARQFKTRVQTDKECDSSVWTETPGDEDKKDKKKGHKDTLEINRLKERDREMEKLAKKAAKSRKKKSLLEIHLKNKKKKKKKEAKEKKDAIPERRPFDRNIDLQIHKFDESKRRAILSKNQFLSNRFAPGQSKFL